MKSIFHRWFGETHPAAMEGDPPLLQLPPPIPINSAIEAQRRSLIGLITRKMAERLHLDRSVQQMLTYLPFATDTFADNQDDKPGYLLYVGGKLLDWIEHDDDVFEQIRTLGMTEAYRDCLYQVYEELKGQLYSLYRRNGACGDAVDQAERGGLWHVYRDVIYAASQRKLLLIRKEEAEAYKEGQVLCGQPIRERADVPKAREAAKAALLENRLPQTQVTGMLLAISEAITNILKHAQSGSMMLVRKAERLYVIVEDTGPGFELKLLPNMTLLAGYSTKHSLGQGFTLMMKMAEQIMLATNVDGSTIILLFLVREGTEGHE